MNSKVGFGIVGSGAVTRFHINAVNSIDNAFFAGIYSTDNETSAAIARQNGTRCFGSFDEMLECDEVDVVNICTPSALHCRQAVRALEKGKNVMVEKPLGLNVAECDEIIRAQRRSGKLCSAVSQHRFSDAALEVSRAVSGGLLGKIITAGAYMRYNRSPEYFSVSSWHGKLAHEGGGALINQSIHGLDLLRMFCGEVGAVNAMSKTLAHRIEVEDTFACVLEFKSGALGVVEGSTCLGVGYPRKTSICGTQGSIELVEDNIMRWDVSVPPLIPVIGDTLHSGANDPTAIAPNGHLRQIAEMADAVLDKGGISNDALSGRETVRLICAIYESAGSGNRIYLD